MFFLAFWLCSFHVATSVLPLPVTAGAFVPVLSHTSGAVLFTSVPPSLLLLLKGSDSHFVVVSVAITTLTTPTEEIMTETRKSSKLRAVQTSGSVEG